jgi:hypothetical protein
MSCSIRSRIVGLSARPSRQRANRPQTRVNIAAVPIGAVSRSNATGTVLGARSPMQRSPPCLAASAGRRRASACRTVRAVPRQPCRRARRETRNRGAACDWASHSAESESAEQRARSVRPRAPGVEARDAAPPSGPSCLRRRARVAVRRRRFTSSSGDAASARTTPAEVAEALASAKPEGFQNAGPVCVARRCRLDFR